jgi:hypothetical protein
MSRLESVLARLERMSDSLSPIVVKEVRQLTRGREFYVSFGISLLIGLAVASLGAADALDGRGTSGGWTFSALMVCLGILGLGVAPLGAFNALRNERMEQTLELITLTSLSPRRVVIGKLLAQGVRLATFFAGLAPFVAMSFLLGGIDFTTIILSMAVLFMWSLWACAGCLFLSSLFKTRAMSGLLFGVVGVVLLLFLVVFGGSRIVGFVFYSGGMVAGSGGGAGGTESWWVLAIMTTFWLASLVNLVLLAENRLSLPSENRITPLRVGLLAQFLLTVAWVLMAIGGRPPVKWVAAATIGTLCGIHLALVAMFAVTEDLVLPRRVLLWMRRRPVWLRPFAMFLPGGGRGAVYVLAQMALLVIAAWLLDAREASVPYVLVMCGYICFYTGVPAAAVRLWRPFAPASFLLRFVVVALLALALLLPDMIAYMWAPSAFGGRYAARHLINPLRTLSSWYRVNDEYGLAIPVSMGLLGLFAYAALFFTGMRMTAPSIPPVSPVPSGPKKAETAAGASDGADIVY